MSDIITEIKKYQKGWSGGLPETPCGSGSRLSNTRQQREWIPEIIKKYGIESIADIGAGDLNWIKKTDLCGVNYQAYDLVPRDPSIIKFDLINEVPPQVDLIMCLWVLNHLPVKHCQLAIENIKASGAKYLMMTDRPKYHKDQPPEIKMESIEEMIIEKTDFDSIKLIKL